MQMSLERRIVLLLAMVVMLFPTAYAQRAIRSSQSGSFTLEQIKSYPVSQ